VVDFVNDLHEKTELPVRRILGWAELAPGRFYDWRNRYGKANEHNGKVPRDHWLLPWEVRAILAFHEQHPLDGYRRIAFMMLDEGLVAASATTVYRVLKAAGVLDRWNGKPSKKGTGFHQPVRPHEHWHIDITYINIAGTFYYLAAILDGYSRFILHWELRESMKEAEIEIILQRAKEKFPDARPRIISDNGPQFIARDFRSFIRLSGMTHVRTSPYYPQSNGKLERWNKTLKTTTIRPRSPATLDEARKLVTVFVEHYNTQRLHSAIGYVTPADKLAARELEIWAERDRRLEAAREQRRLARAGSPTAHLAAPSSVA
jgi:transposase InsO family protein